MQNIVISTRITSLNEAQTSPAILCMQNSSICTRITRLCGSQTSPVVLCMQNSVAIIRITSLYGSQTSCLVLSTHNSVLSTWIKRLYWFQPPPVILCIQNSHFRTRTTSLHGSQTSSVVFVCKTAWFAPELQDSVSPRPHLSFCDCKTACLASELVSMGPNTHLWFLHAKQRLLDKNYKSLLVQDLNCGFVHSKQHA